MWLSMVRSSAHMTWSFPEATVHTTLVRAESRTPGAGARAFEASARNFGDRPVETSRPFPG